MAYRDLFFDIKRPVVVVGSEYEIKEIQRHAPDWFRFRFRFRSRTYEPKEERPGEERAIMRLAEPAEPKPVFVKFAKEFLRKRKQNLLSYYYSLLRNNRRCGFLLLTR